MLPSPGAHVLFTGPAGVAPSWIALSRTGLDLTLVTGCGVMGQAPFVRALLTLSTLCSLPA